MPVLSYSILHCRYERNSSCSHSIISTLPPPLLTHPHIMHFHITIPPFHSFLSAKTENWLWSAYRLGKLFPIYLRDLAWICRSCSKIIVGGNEEILLGSWGRFQYYFHVQSTDPPSLPTTLPTSWGPKYSKRHRGYTINSYSSHVADVREATRLGKPCTPAQVQESHAMINFNTLS